MMGILGQLPDIEDISLPEPVPSPWPVVIGIAVGAIVIGAAVWLILFFIREDAKRKAPEMPPHIRALRELDRLGEKIGDLPPNQFSQSVSQTLEAYLEAQFGDRYRYETAEELIQRLATNSASNVPERKRQNLAEFVTIAEEIKFGLPPDAEARKEPLLEKARSIVTE